MSLQKRCGSRPSKNTLATRYDDFVVAPEHRLSLELKVKELHLDGDIELSKELGNLSFKHRFDIFNEVDEIPHHCYQLVYSIGPVQPWQSIQASLKVVKSVSSNGITATCNESQPESYPWICFEGDINVVQFRAQVAELLLASPPLEVDWLRNHHKKEHILQVITVPKADPTDLGSTLSEEHFHDILALRGLFSHDTLIHCLKKRHGVEYGVNLQGRNRVAVPFRGGGGIRHLCVPSFHILTVPWL